MNKIKIRLGNDHVETISKQMSEYNPVILDLPDFIPHHNELKDIEFDVEQSDTFFLSNLFFAGLSHGIESTAEATRNIILKFKNNI